VLSMWPSVPAHAITPIIVAPLWLRASDICRGSSPILGPLARVAPIEIWISLVRNPPVYHG
jgi:hypothetical protein